MTTSGQKLEAFCCAVEQEIYNSRVPEDGFPKLNSLEEGYGVLTKQYKQLEALVFMQRPVLAALNDSHPYAFQNMITKECVQLAAVAYTIISECFPDITPEAIENYAVPDDSPADYFPPRSGNLM